MFRKDLEESTPTESTPSGDALSRHSMLRKVGAGAAGVAAISMAWPNLAHAAGSIPDQQPSFQALGPAPGSGAGFDALAAVAGDPIFTTGVQAAGTTYGVKGSGPGTGVYGSGNELGVWGANLNNKTGILGISYADATQKTHGSGIGVQGDSGSGFGVLGSSDSGTGVYGQSKNIGVAGHGATGVQGITTTGVGVSGDSSTGTGVQGQTASGTGVVGRANSGTGVAGSAGNGIGVQGTNNSDNQAAIYGSNGSGGSGVWGVSLEGPGVLGTSDASPSIMGQGCGVVGSNLVGQGAGVVGYSLASTLASDHQSPPLGTGVFGLGDDIGVNGVSSSIGVRGANTSDGPAIIGISFKGPAQRNQGAGTGVEGHSGSGFGVAGFSNTSSGVYGQSTQVGVSGQGAVGIEGLSPSGTGVSGQGGSGTGVVALNKSSRKPALLASNDDFGTAVEARSVGGYGAELYGGRAPLRLIPRNSKGAPRSGGHQAGELVMDDAGSLFVCTKSGKPGTWRRVLLD